MPEPLTDDTDPPGAALSRLEAAATPGADPMGHGYSALVDSLDVLAVAIEYRRLMAENARLRADRDRLDHLDAHPVCWVPGKIREAVDAAIAAKETGAETPCDPDAGPPPRWRDRLVFDLNVSETSPVVKGTWVTVGHVVSLVVDGWTWSDILRTHPELTEDDVRACLAYAVEREQDDATGDPPAFTEEEWAAINERKDGAR